MRAGPRAAPRRRSSSTRPSTRTRRRTSVTCATRRSATRSSACCASAARRSRCRTTSTTPACRSPTSSSASGDRAADARGRAADRRDDPVRLLLLGSLLARHRAGTTPTRSGSPIRAAALHDIEHGGNDTAATWRAFVADRIVRCHLTTMARLNIGYDLLTWEGDILRLQFWAHAFEILKAQGAVFLQTEGTAGRLLGHAHRRERGRSPTNRRGVRRGRRGRRRTRARRSSCDRTATVTYVGKDIAYQFWKFGLLGRTSATACSRSRPDGRPLWSTTSGDGRPGCARVRRRDADLQRHRLAAVVPAGAAQPGAADARPSGAGRATRSISRTRWWRCSHADGRSGARGPCGRRCRHGDARKAVRRGVRAQGPRRQDRRSARPAGRQGVDGSREAQSRASRPTNAAGLHPSDRRRRDPLLHGEVLARQADRLRHRRGAQLRGRERALPAVCCRPRQQHLPQAAGARRGDRGGS